MVIGMTEDQVKEACVKWAEGHNYTNARVTEVKSDGTVFLDVQMKPPVKRQRKAKSAT